MFVFYDLISVSVVMCIFVPWCLFIFYEKPVYAVFALGVIGAEVLTHMLKYILGTSLDIFKRPLGAANCSLLNKGGPCENCPGFPSGHVTLATTFVVLGLLIMRHKVTDSIFYIWCLVGLIYIFLVAISRIKKKCHTALQTAAGFFCGVIFSMLWWWLFSRVTGFY
jgi:membrane-associated phospholipid phosphatase